MSLFPAYAVEASEASTATPSALVRDFALQQPFNNAVSDACMDIDSVGVGDEASLLASDSDEELPTTASHPQATTPLDLTDFYLDTKLDRGNLRVSTLYYPGRPEYKADGCVVGRRSKKARRERRVRRYWEEVPVGGAGDAAEQRAARTQAYQAMLREDPTNERLWLQFIDFQEAHYDGLACVSAATAARSRLPRAPSLRARHHRAAQDHLPIDDYLGLLRDEIAQEQSPHVVTELWVRMVEGIGGAAARCSLTAISELAAAAVQRTRHHAPAYPQILYHLGSLLRSCGLWERLVLLLELQVSLNLPPCRLPTPPPADPRAELKLRELEDKLVCSALPLFSVWGRVERARAAAHWAPATPEEAVKSSDSARDPQAAELAPLLLPLVNRDALCQLAINMLRIVDVPLLGLGGGGAGLRALHGAGSTDEAARRGAGGAGALLPLLAARPPPAPRTPAVMRLIALAIDPPTYFSDDYGHLTWVCGLWSSLCTWAAGRVRSALLAWRVRWHHALLLSAQEAGGGCGAEGARVRSMLRAALRSCDGGWLPAAELARVEALACGAARGARAAAQVLRAAVQDVDAADEELVYIARIVSELSGVHSAVSRWALVSAVLRRSLPNDAAPSDDLLQEARDKVSSRCELIEDRLGQLADAGAAGDAEGEGEMDAVSALLPGAAEWAAARVLLSGQHDLAGLYGRLMQTKHWSWSNVLEASRYHEEASEALVGRAGSAGRDGAGWARALSQLHPHSPLLAAVSGVAPLWAGGAPPEPPSSPVAALGAALPSLLAAIEIDTQDSWRVCARVLRRVLTAAPRAGALLWTLRGEAAARAGEPTAAVTYRAIDLEPSCKWLYVRGATWGAGGGAAGGADGAALEELLLEKQLRTHALSDELTH